jgi:hypothetical protein
MTTSVRYSLVGELKDRLNQLRADLDARPTQLSEAQLRQEITRTECLIASAYDSSSVTG